MYCIISVSKSTNGIDKTCIIYNNFMHRTKWTLVRESKTKLKSGNIHLNTIISTHTLENAGCIYPRTHGTYGYSSNIYKYRKQGKKKNKEKQSIKKSFPQEYL